MPPTLLRKTLRDDRRAIIGWAVGVSFFVTIYLPFYTQFQEDAEIAQEMMEIFPEGMRAMMGIQDLVSGAGYLEGMIYSLYGPLILIVFAMVLGNRAIAVPEESGHLDQLLALPISRRRFFLERFAALVLGVVLVGLVTWGMVMAFETGLDMGVGAAHVTAASMGLTLLALVFGTLTLTVGALTGSRAMGLGVTGAVVIASYVVRVLSSAGAEAMEPLRWISPFHYYLGGDPLRADFPLGYFAVLAGIIVVLAVLAVGGFERRDVGV